nr:spidroin-1-like [Aegilops tauschii subsp. strangulata]
MGAGGAARADNGHCGVVAGGGCSGPVNAAEAAECGEYHGRAGGPVARPVAGVAAARRGFRNSGWRLCGGNRHLGGGAPEVETSDADGEGSGAVVMGSGAMVVVGSGRDGVGGGEDMTATELTDTKVVGARALPGLGRRLYGEEGGGRGLDRNGRRAGAVSRGGGGGGDARVAG